ncbi:hydroxyisourate hydrolase [Aeromicrobium sp. 179-A 4D2 NHS]|uniref:hydroxyisourate hydrolase n=1 Tax=Aeromicrobium sp. 179-A 4D2 NHS TaxID=3142375 RepID=UPI0039A0E949
MTTLSTHVLDQVLGVPASGLVVLLDGAVVTATDDDGRIRFEGQIAPGPHTLDYAIADWFAARDRDAFFGAVRLTFEVEPGRPHLHVALLLGPYSYTAYRGS